MGSKMKIVHKETPTSCSHQYCSKALILLFIVASLKCSSLCYANVNSLQELQPPRPPLLPAVIPRLSWLVRYGTSDENGEDQVVNGENDGLIISRPQLALVPVVEHEQPFVMFWYPLHPQIPIKNYYY